MFKVSNNHSKSTMLFIQTVIKQKAISLETGLIKARNTAKGYPIPPIQIIPHTRVGGGNYPETHILPRLRYSAIWVILSWRLNEDVFWMQNYSAKYYYIKPNNINRIRMHKAKI